MKHFKKISILAVTILLSSTILSAEIVPFGAHNLNFDSNYVSEGIKFGTGGYIDSWSYIYDNSHGIHHESTGLNFVTRGYANYGFNFSRINWPENQPKINHTNLSILMRINGDGRVGIGTIYPQARLDIVGTEGLLTEIIKIRNPQNGFEYPGSWIGMYQINSQSSLHIGGITGTDNKRRILFAAEEHYFDGNIGLGTTAPQSKLHVVGDVRIDGNITASATVTANSYSCSDRRYKKDIVPVASAMHKLSLLNGVYYNWKTTEFKEKGFSDKRDMGFIAQDLEKVFPEVVFTDSKGYKSVAYSKLTAVIVEALKEQNKEVVSLRKENTELKQQVASLQKMSERIAQLEIMVNSEYVGMK